MAFQLGLNLALVCCLTVLVKSATVNSDAQEWDKRELDHKKIDVERSSDGPKSPFLQQERDATPANPGIIVSIVDTGDTVGKWVISESSSSVFNVEVSVDDGESADFGMSWSWWNRDETSNAPLLSQKDVPFLVSIRVTLEGLDIVGSGVIYSEKAFLTTATFAEQVEQNNLTATVIAGAFDLDEESAEFVDVDRIVIHPQYNNNSDGYLSDLAVLITNQSLTLSANSIWPIPLPDDSQSTCATDNGTSAFVVDVAGTYKKQETYRMPPETLVQKDVLYYKEIDIEQAIPEGIYGECAKVIQGSPLWVEQEEATDGEREAALIGLALPYEDNGWVTSCLRTGPIEFIDISCHKEWIQHTVGDNTH